LRPERVNRSWIFTNARPAATQPAMFVRRAASKSHPAPWPGGRAGRDAAITAPISSSVNAGLGYEPGVL